MLAVHSGGNMYSTVGLYQAIQKPLHYLVLKVVMKTSVTCYWRMHAAQLCWAAGFRSRGRGGGGGGRGFGRSGANSFPVGRF